MEEKLDKLYNEIANRVVSIIPSKWEKIYFRYKYWCSAHNTWCQ